MNRAQALEIAKANRSAHVAADIANLFHGAPAFDAFERFGFRHGWYSVGKFSFNNEDLTGQKYDPTQGGWAFI